METIFIDLPAPARDISRETMSFLRTCIQAGGADPALLYVLATVTTNWSGAEQAIRGPADPHTEDYQFVFWRADAPDPGGWPVRLRICTKATLPRWARRAMRGAGRITLTHLNGPTQRRSTAACAVSR